MSLMSSSAAGSLNLGAVFPTESIAHGAEPYRFSVSAYHEMAHAGIFEPGTRVELLEGIVYMMSPIGAPHSTAVDLIYRVFLRLLPPGWEVSAQRDVVLSTSVPQPDICILRGRLHDYSVEKPKASDLGLVIEVAESSLGKDRVEMQRIYAAAAIPEYWIVNLIDRKLEVHRKPIAAAENAPARYESIDVLDPEASVDVILDGTKVGTVAVRDVLP